MDFTDLNKVYPKDSFPLPRVDVTIDSTAGHKVLSFMDAYSGYNQIWMNKTDAEKITFIIDKGLYCYRVMPFGLKNAGATYQRLVNQMFKPQIGKTMEVNSSKFLRFMMLEKIDAILNLALPRSINDAQRLEGRVATLNRSLRPEWAKEILEYLEANKLLERKEAARKVRRNATLFIIIDGVSYKKGFAAPLLRCISPEEAQFGIPNSIVFDNGKQFDSDHYREWCRELGIQVKYSSPRQPQAKGQAKSTNKSLLGILKKKLGEKKGAWIEELLGVLWAYKTTMKTLTGRTLFTLAFGSEAVALVEVALPTYRTNHFNSVDNNETLEEHLDLFEEMREEAEVQNILN
ncbi:hypothetical protein F2P56_008909 [Juglans regia]|uniref:Uncharacterized protein LOC108981547 n=2 Tax=Juglans regia TaxID=51240 RepID=A0A2I4DMC9_JUGRE|nr:uncharacterized protein LOC108981547 [Juglans regia]KAF5472171.1 hypothetical protein F2P56_008909 [Juglans regia]